MDAGQVERVRILVAIAAAIVVAALLSTIASLVGVAAANLVTAPVIVAITLILGDGILTRLSGHIIDGAARQIKLIFAAVSLIGILLAATCWQRWDVIATAPGLALGVGGLVGLLKSGRPQAGDL